MVARVLLGLIPVTKLAQRAGTEALMNELRKSILPARRAKRVSPLESLSST